MAAPFSRHWAHPQAIPRGFLRIYILRTLSLGPSTGYDIMQRIDDKTEGAWRPGAGTVYPLLKGLVREKLVTASAKTSRTSKVTYSITQAGRQELEKMYAGMASFGRKERVIMRLVSDLIPNKAFVPLMLNRSREGAEFMRAKISELPEPERTSALRDLESITENQLDWIRSNLEPKQAVGTRRRALR